MRIPIYTVWAAYPHYEIRRGVGCTPDGVLIGTLSQTPKVVPAGLSQWARRWGFARLIETREPWARAATVFVTTVSAQLKPVEGYTPPKIVDKSEDGDFIAVLGAGVYILETPFATIPLLIKSDGGVVYSVLRKDEETDAVAW